MDPERDDTMGSGRHIPSLSMRVAEIVVYPLKSGNGSRPGTWRIEGRGFELDREWMLVGRDGVAITQLTSPRIFQIQPVIENRIITFHAPDVESMQLPVEDIACGLPDVEDVEMSGPEAIQAVPVGSSAVNGWFSHVLGMECSLVRRSDGAPRWAEQDPESGRPLNFQNAAELHLVSESSLEDLNARLATPVTMDRFRPNLVISGTLPHADDRWKRIQIGEVILNITRACDHRCGIPNIDQFTGERTPEPLRTLATYRRSSKGIYFGQNASVERVGEVRVGDPVTVLEYRSDGEMGPLTR